MAAFFVATMRHKQEESHQGEGVHEAGAHVPLSLPVEGVLQDVRDARARAAGLGLYGKAPSRARAWCVERSLPQRVTQFFITPHPPRDLSKR